MDELKPCPFCGGKAYMAQNYLGQKYVWCAECGAGVFGKDEEDWRVDTIGEREARKAAADAWNRRAKTVGNKIVNKNAEKQEWTVVPPCKVGDRVYAIWYDLALRTQKEEGESDG